MKNTDKLKENSLLHIEDVYKSYGDNVILDDIDLSVAKGEFCTLVGPSGCGKSTLLRLILGQEMPDKGQILINGKDAGPPDLRRGIVYQKYSLFPHLTVLENVLLGHKLNSSASDIPYEELKDKAIHYLTKVRLQESLHKYPHELSGGMRQRVAVIQTLIVNPEIVLMDEPFGALDPGTREDIQMLLLDLWKEYKMTIFFVTHDLEEALFLGSRLLVLSQFYQSDKGYNENEKHGSKIVTDWNIKPDLEIISTKTKRKEHFQELIVKIRQNGFEASYMQRLEEFDLQHPHSFRTDNI